MRRWMGLALGAALLAGCSSLDKLNPFAPPPPKVKPAELSPFEATAALSVRWQASAGKSPEHVFSPAVVGSRVYAASQDGSLSRFDDGKQAWRIGAGQPISGGVGADGKLVVVGTPKGEALAFDAETGKPLWRARASSEILAPPVVADGLVVVRSGDSRIFGFDAADGRRRWVYQRSMPALSLRSNVGVRFVDGAVVAGFPGGKLVAISTRNGAALWEATVALPKGATELERVADVTSIPAIDGREVCASAFQGRVACFDLPSGNMLWARDISSSAGVDIDDRHVYIADDKGAVHALDRTNGASVWKQDKLSMRGLSKPLAFGRHVAVADFQGFVHLLRRDDGAFAARIATDGSSVSAAPEPHQDGLIVQTRNGGLYALTAR